MPSINKVILVGHAGADAVSKFRPNGDTIMEFSLATSKGKDKGADWHNIELWNPPDWLQIKKGDLVYVEGALRYTSWMGKDGVKRTRTKIVGFCANMGQRIEQGPVDATESETNDLPF